jgi:hypothetical protein
MIHSVSGKRSTVELSPWNKSDQTLFNCAGFLGSKLYSKHPLALSYLATYYPTAVDKVGGVSRVALAAFGKRASVPQHFSGEIPE